MIKQFVSLIIPVVSVLHATTAFGQFHLASGLGAAWTIRKDYGDDAYFRFRTELPVYAYLPVWEPLWFRGGVRLGYSDDQPEMPGALRINERDFSYAFETTAVLDGYVMPSLGVGYGIINRKITLKTSDKIEVEDDRISGNETLSFWQTQLGLGVPILKGFVVMEPFVRYWDIKSDDRSTWSFGFDITVQAL